MPRRDRNVRKSSGDKSIRGWNIILSCFNAFMLINYPSVWFCLLVFFECGVGRIDSKGNWQIVNGMLRFYSRGTKKTVVKKKAARLGKKEQVELFISRIELENGRLEVCTSMEDVEHFLEKNKKKVPASSLKPQQELVGTVVNVLPYGVMVDVGANRNGLLHISKVADLYGRYIDKEQGLVEAGLERGAKIRVAVYSNEKKKLSLDFTPDVKVEAETDRKQQEEEKQKRKAKQEALLEKTQEDTTQDSHDSSEEEAAMWAAYSEIDDDDEEEDEGNDEDRAIEDAFGLGTY